MNVPLGPHHYAQVVPVVGGYLVFIIRISPWGIVLILYYGFEFFIDKLAKRYGLSESEKRRIRVVILLGSADGAWEDYKPLRPEDVYYNGSVPAHEQQKAT